MVITGPCWDSGRALGWASSGCRGGAAAWGTPAALDGSVTQVQIASFRYRNKGKKHTMPVTGNVWDLEGASVSPVGMYLTRFPSFPSPILSLFFGNYFPVLSFLPVFFYLVCIEVFPIPLLSWPSTEKVRGKQQSFANAKAIYETQES